MIEFVATDVAHGGAAVGRIDGKTHFIDGVLPGERVRGQVVQDKKSWARVELSDVLDASPARVDAPCPYFGRCGGCQWQFAEYDSQLAWKRSIVVGQMQHLGRLDDPPVRETVTPGTPYGYRNRMDFRVDGGRPAFSRRRSNSLVAVSGCLLLHPVLAEVYQRIEDLGDARAVTVRVSATTGKVLVIVRGAVPESAAGWGCAVSHRDRTGVHAVIGTGAIEETVAGATFRITGDAFFQTNTPGAEALVELVTEALSPGPDDTLLDAYAGGGLFAATVGAGTRHVIAVESNGLGVFDLKHNLGESDIDHRIVKSAVEDMSLGGSWDIAVVDPPREGLRTDGVGAVVAGNPRAIAYVSCDPASLARDTAYLAEAGYHLDWATPVDLFPQTFHIETVAAFTRV